jgi:ribose-phosphate pyrophosphokinase
MTAPLLFAPLASRPFGERMAAALTCGLAPLEEKDYEGGEHKIRALTSVRNRNV